MRYVLIDRIVSLAPGRTLSGFKNVTAAEDLVSDEGRGRRALPASMVLEAMAQGAGLLALATSDGRSQPVLAKVQPFASYGDAVPGDQVRIDAALEDVRTEGCRARVTASIDGRPLADATVYLGFVALDDAQAAVMRAALEETFPEVLAGAAHASGSGGVREARPLGRMR